MIDLLTKLGALLSEFWSNNSGELWAALAGAFAGAFAAYRLQLSVEKRKERDQQHSSIIQAQLALISQLDNLARIRRDHLDPLKSDPARDRKLLLLSVPPKCLDVSLGSLAFLLETDDADLVLQVQVAERAYYSSMDALSDRNQAVRDLHRNSHLTDVGSDPSQVTVLAEHRDVVLVKNYTDSVFESFYSAEDLSKRAIENLNTTGKRIYPKRRFLSATIAEHSTKV